MVDFRWLGLGMRTRDFSSVGVSILFLSLFVDRSDDYIHDPSYCVSGFSEPPKHIDCCCGGGGGESRGGKMELL